MQNILPEDLSKTGFTKGTVQTLSGITLANYMVCTGIEKAFNYNPSWFSLATSVVICLGVCLFVNKKRSVGTLFLALLGAFPVFLGTAGANTVIVALVENQKKKDVVQSQGAMIELLSFIQPKSWWLDDIIQNAELDARLAQAEAEKFSAEKDDAIKNTESTLAQVTEKANEIIRDPTKSIQVAESIKNLTSDAKSNLQKQVQPAPTPNTNSAQNTAESKKVNKLNIAKDSVLNINKAKEAEKQGFQYLIAKDFGRAIESFEQANTNYPDYHNCYEIAKYLKANSGRDVKEIYKTILTKYSWGMPTDVRDQMRQLADGK